MAKAVILRGRLSDSRHIELDEPVPGIEGEVEVVLRAVAPSVGEVADVFDIIAATAPGTRSKEDIDRQLAQERDGWGDR
jgi:hypothetical protein